VSKPTIRDIFERPDQGRVRADLATFFGPQAETYLRIYDKMRANSKNWVMSWSWSGFLAPIVWLFYRKLYLYGALCIVVPLVLAFVFDLSAGSSIAVVIGMSAKAWYVGAGLQRIAKADELGLLDKERRDYLRRAGGVSTIAGVLVGIAYAAIIVLIIFSIVTGLDVTTLGDGG
jgi:Protein of unknown function (DUF2628)